MTPETFAALAQAKAIREVGLTRYDTNWEAYIIDAQGETHPIETARRPARPKTWKWYDTAAAWIRSQGYAGIIMSHDGI